MTGRLTPSERIARIAARIAKRHAPRDPEPYREARAAYLARTGGYRVEVECVWCGARFTVGTTTAKFCSAACQRACWAWNDGRTP